MLRKSLPRGVAVSALAVAAAVTLAGTGTASRAQDATITLRYTTPLTTEVIDLGERPLIEEFMRQNPDVRVEIEQIPFSNYKGHPQFVWCRGSIRALSKFGPARPYIARFKVFNRLIWPSA